MSEQRVLDVSSLPESTVDSRALIWWGNLGMMTIEGTLFAMTIATFLYLRTANLDWPPATVPKPDLLWPTINLILLLLSGIPALIADRAAAHQNKRRAMAGMGLVILAGIAVAVIRSWNMAHIGYTWSDHAFGSIVWVVVGLHSFHLIGATAENTMLMIYAALRPMTKKRFLDFRCGAVYWYFVILSWLPFYFLIFIQPWMHRKG
jgi:heme/copper-type cytochrome/quinol oxidase subunit 3